MNVEVLTVNLGPLRTIINVCSKIIFFAQFCLKSSTIESKFNVPSILYKNIYVYDYSIYYSIEMQRFENQFNYDLSVRSVDLPGKVKAELFWSKYFIKKSKGAHRQ